MPPSSQSRYAMALYPQFDVASRSTTSSSHHLQTCVCCRGKIAKTNNDVLLCDCKSCVYCSEECKAIDSTVHAPRCSIIQAKTKCVSEWALRFDQYLEFEDMYQEDYPENLFEFGVDRHDRSLCPNETTTYFTHRQALIEELVKEGLARAVADDDDDDSCTEKTNHLALDIAVMQCRDMLILDKFDSYFCRADGFVPKKELLMNLCLFTGRYQELYDLCCFYARNGDRYFPHSSTKYIGSIQSPNTASREDVTKSFFQRNSLHHESFPLAALNHMFILKAMLHEKMEALIMIDSHFLSNKDCTTLIGEYAGVKREWLVFDKDWYNNQALEVLQPFVGCKASTSQFGKLYGCSELFLRCQDYRHIAAIRFNGLNEIESQAKDVKSMANGSVTSSTYNEADDPFCQHVKDETGIKTMFMMTRETSMKYLIREYALSRGVDVSSVVPVLHDIGVDIGHDETPESLALFDNIDSVECRASTDRSQKRQKLDVGSEPVTLRNAVFLCRPNGEIEPESRKRAKQSGLAEGDLNKVAAAARERARMSRWGETLEYCIADHRAICKRYILPLLNAAIDKLNSIAGYDVLSKNEDYSLGSSSGGQCCWELLGYGEYCLDHFITQFTVNAMKTCHENFYEFDDFIGYLDNLDENNVTEMSWQPSIYDFSYGLMVAIVLERKIAQAFQYIGVSKRRIKWPNPQSSDDLTIEPAVANKLHRMYPPPLEEYDMFTTFPMNSCRHPSFSRRVSDIISASSRWMKDVTDVVDAIYKANLATDKQLLSHIFGDSSFVSNTIWELDQVKVKTSQPSVKFLLSNHLNLDDSWGRGRTTVDRTSGLKIRYLGLVERRMYYIAAPSMTKARILNLSPTIAEFRKRFQGEEDLKLEFVDEEQASGAQREKYYGITNGMRNNLDDFETVEDACRYFFDTSSLEDAAYDCLGIPRLFILNGDGQTMLNSGWKYKGGIGSFLGDKSVKIGSRIAVAQDSLDKTGYLNDIWAEPDWHRL